MCSLDWPPVSYDIQHFNVHTSWRLVCRNRSIAFSRYLPNGIVECSGCADDQTRLQTRAFRIASGVIDTRTFANMQDDEGYAIHLRIRVLFAMYIIDVR